MSRPLEPKEEHQMYYEVFSLNLSHYRRRLHMTQIQIAYLAGISSKYLSLLESSAFQNAPSMEVIFSLAEALQVEPFQLFMPLSAPANDTKPFFQTQKFTSQQGMREQSP